MQVDLFNFFLINHKHQREEYLNNKNRIDLHPYIFYAFLISKGVQVVNDCKDGETAEMGAPPSYVKLINVIGT
jgi:hypothetical protein